MKILVLSWEPWNGTNSFGNTYSSIFRGMNNIEIANISCRYGDVDNDIVSHSFQITEKSILKSILKKTPVGIEQVFNAEKIISKSKQFESSGYSSFQWKIINWIRTHRFIPIFWMRDLIWKTGRWKCNELNTFVHDFNPDIIWIPIYYSTYLNDIALYLKKITGKKVVGYISDDNYTLKQFSLSPLYWLDRFIKRRNVKKVILESDLLYVITQKQKDEYEKIFNKKCNLLWKGANFEINKPIELIPKEPLSMVFMGNLGLNRWKSVVDILNVLKEINREKIRIKLDIYTLSPLTRKMEKLLNIHGMSRILPPINSDQIQNVFRNADILLHVEPTNLKHKLMYRHSFSTKLVDCFAAARCIFAYGGNTGSLDYLLRNNVGIVVCEKSKLKNSILELINNKDLLREQGTKSWECGVKFHNTNEIQSMIMTDLYKLEESNNRN